MFSKLKPKSEFTRNVLTLMTGTTIAQAIPIAISPILTRIYTPEDFGIFTLYISFASIVSVIATGRYELAIMLPKNNKDTINLMLLSFLITLFISFITLIIVYFFNSQISNMLGNPEISPWLYFIPITVLLTGVYQILNYRYNRSKHYKLLAKSKIIQSATTATSNIYMGFSGFGSSGLIISGLLGQGLAVVIFLKNFWLNDKKQFKYLSKYKMIDLARKYKKFPIYNLPNALIDGFRISGISIFIAKFFTTAFLGQFSLAWRMLQMPSSLIASSLSQVFFQKVASSNKKELNRIVKSFIFKSFLISLPIFLIIYFFATDIFVIVFGDKWKQAGAIASILAPWIMLNFITSPISTLFIVLNKQDILFIFSIFYMMIPLSILFFLNKLGFFIVLKLISFSMTILLLIFIYLVLFYTKKEAK